MHRTSLPDRVQDGGDTLRLAEHRQVPRLERLDPHVGKPGYRLRLCGWRGRLIPREPDVEARHVRGDLAGNGVRVEARDLTSESLDDQARGRLVEVVAERPPRSPGGGEGA
jgi:hypothetical protein